MAVPQQKLDCNSLHISDLLEELVNHPLYNRINSLDNLRIFMRTHVFCVWDFQSLLKSLQRHLTCVDVPWLPSADPHARRLINEIVLDEESDEMQDNTYLSHFELYINAMRQSMSDAEPILTLIAELQRGVPISQALKRPDLPPGVARFVSHTLEVAQSGQVHRIAAAFTYGREDIIPSMFLQIVRALGAHDSERWQLFLLYLNRHIEHDGERHGPLSKALVQRLCGDVHELWVEAEETARMCLRARIRLWDHIVEGLYP